MARLKLPETFADEQTLLTNILAKHVELGTKSPLIILFKQQKLDAAKLKSSIGLAAEQNTASSNLRRESEEDTEERDALMQQPWANLLGEVQFLKHLNAGMERQLGEWGVTVDGKDRIAYPTGVVAEATLIQTFLNHHLALGDESPLLFYLAEHEEIDVAADLAAAGDVIAKNAERNQVSGDSKEATQQRDKIWEPSVKAMHVIGAFLMGLYHEDDRKMAAWGFVVVEDAAGERTQVSMIDPLTSKNLTGIKIPSILINVGTDAIRVIRGKGDKAVTTIVESGKQLGMTKGYSKITVYNPSTLSIAKVQVTVSK
jgi:hypothetical protein